MEIFMAAGPWCWLLNLVCAVYWLVLISEHISQRDYLDVEGCDKCPHRPSNDSARGAV